MKRFFATAIKCYEEDEVLTVALGDDAQNPSNFLIITRLDDEENDAVDDCIGLQTDQTQYEVSGVISGVILRLNRLKLIINSDCAEFFGGSDIVVEFSPRHDELSINYVRLKESLQKIFSGSKVDFTV